MSLTMFFGPVDERNPVLKAIHENARYQDWLLICVPIGIIAAAVQAAAGVGLLKLKPWARITSIGYGIYAILFCMLNMVISYFLLTRPLLEQVSGQQGPQAAAAIGGAVGGAIGGCVGTIYPVLLIIFMTRPKVVAAFKQPSNVSSGAM